MLPDIHQIISEPLHGAYFCSTCSMWKRFFFLHSIGMTVLKNGNNRHSSLYNERIALTAYPDQGRLLKPCLHPSAFQSVCRSMCDALHASTWEWTYTMCLGLYVSECRLLSQWQSSLFVCVGFMRHSLPQKLSSLFPAQLAVRWFWKNLILIAII